MYQPGKMKYSRKAYLMHDLSSQYLYSTNVVHVHVFKLLFFFRKMCAKL